MNNDTLKLIASAGGFSWIIYWTGRWYKEWYFAQFNIPYEILGFDAYYYLHGSWATVLVAILSLVILFNLLLSIWLRVSWIWMVFALLVGVFGISRLFINIPFHPEQAFFQKIFTSKDLSIMALGFISIASLVISSWRYGEARQSLSKLYVLVTGANLFSLFVAAIVLWAYMAVCGYMMGVYHGQAAIWEGKMRTKWVKSGGEWWVLVVRADANRIFLYDRAGKRMSIVSDESSIEEWDGFVTRDSK